jgi:hypothetical protein
MNAYTIRSEGTSFTRISKAKARKLWSEAKHNIALCPVKLRPGFPWAPQFTFLAGEQKELDFNWCVTRFVWYNCQHNEIGYYPAFYLVTQ